MSRSTDPPTTENHRVTKAAGVVGSATLLSRIFGFIRDVVIAWFFGAGLVSDAFFVAFRIPNLLRRLFAEGSLSVAFIPVFTQYLTQQGQKDAFEMAKSAIRLLSVLLVAIAVVGILLSPIIVRLIAVAGPLRSQHAYLNDHVVSVKHFPDRGFISLADIKKSFLIQNL